MLIFLTGLAWFSIALLAAYMAYFVLLALPGLRKDPVYPAAPPANRFAVLVAARNEEAVIGALVESLMAQEYPRAMYDVIVIPNNCTDDTAGAAARAGALVWECAVPVRSKGQVLSFAVDKLLEEENPYDAICVFDADNLVDPGFLQAMNDARCAGIRMAQGRRDSKNPCDTVISGCSSIYYWMLNKYFNNSRWRFGLSAVVNGSGFMADLELLRQWGGWHSRTMVEDLEFTGQCALQNTRIGWVPGAITYDEQPLTFSQSWKQRKRWSTGIIQCMTCYTIPLIRPSRRGRWLRMDSLLLYLCPAMQLLCLLPLVLGGVLYLLHLPCPLFGGVHFAALLLLSLLLTFLGTFLAAMFAISSAGKPLLPMARAAVLFWAFILTWIPITLLCTFRRQKTWEPIQHTRAIRPGQFFRQTMR